MKKLLLIGLIISLSYCALLMAYVQKVSEIVGYTQPQIEHYSDGTSDIISYPIYRAQEATK